MRKRKKNSGNVVRDRTRGDDGFNIETIYAGTSHHVKPRSERNIAVRAVRCNVEL